MAVDNAQKNRENNPFLYDIPAEENDAFMKAREDDFARWLTIPEKSEYYAYVAKQRGEAAARQEMMRAYAAASDGEVAFRRNWYDTRGERQKASAEKSDQDRTDALIDAFYKRMTRPLDMYDPEVQRISKLVGDAASSRAQDQARLQGVEGGLAVANTEQAVSNAVTPALAGLQSERNQMALNALSMKNQRGLNMAQLNQQAAQSDLAYRTAMQEKQRQEALASGQTWGSIIGGGLGALGLFAGPAVGAATMSAGAGLGGAIGGQLAGNSYGGGYSSRFSSQPKYSTGGLSRRGY